jgi:hypothetical protein
MPTLTLTRPGDTWHAIALEHYGYNYDYRDLQDLLSANGQSIYFWNRNYQLQSFSRRDLFCSLPEYRAIWLPQNNRDLTGYDEALVRRLDSMSLRARYNLAQLEEAGINPNYALAATQFSLQVQKHSAKKSDINDQAQKLSIAMSLAIADETGDQIRDNVEELLKKIRVLNKAAVKNAASKLFNDEVQAAYNDATAALNRGTMKLANRLVGFKLDTQANIMKAARNAYYFRRLRGFSVMSLEAMENLSGLSRFLNVMFPFGMVGVDVLLAIVEMMEAHGRNEDWEDVGVKSIGEITGTIVGNRYIWPSLKQHLPELIRNALPNLAKSEVADSGLTLLGIADAGELGIAALATAEFWIPIIIGAAVIVGSGYLFKNTAEIGYQLLRKII